MDAFARGLKVAHKLIEDRVFDDFIEQRYSSFASGIGQDIVEGRTNFHTLEAYILDKDTIKNVSGRTEQLKATLNQYLLEV
jgi:xylose isomerase